MIAQLKAFCRKHAKTAEKKLVEVVSVSGGSKLWHNWKVGRFYWVTKFRGQWVLDEDLELMKNSKTNVPVLRVLPEHAFKEVENAHS